MLKRLEKCYIGSAALYAVDIWTIKKEKFGIFWYVTIKSNKGNNIKRQNKKWRGVEMNLENKIFEREKEAGLDQLKKNASWWNISRV